MNGRALERCEIVDVEPAILRTGGNDHGTRANVFLVGEREQKASAIQSSLGLQGLDLIGDRHVDTEFLRLVKRARHQGDTGNPGREAQIIFDSRRRASLTAERATIQHQHGKTLGGCVNRGGEARRAGADDDHVINLVRIDRPDQSKATGKPVFAGTAQQFAAGAQNDWQFAGFDVEALDQCLRIRISLWVQALVRMPVVGKKSFEPQDIGMSSAADDHRPASPGLEETYATQD